MSEFTTWAALGTYGGALAMVLLITQFTKDLSFTKNIPTQIWSYIMSFIILIAANFFSGVLTLELAALTIFNALMVSLAANGTHTALTKKSPDGELLIDSSNSEKDIYRLDVGSIDKLSNKKKVTLTVKQGQDLS